MTENGNSKESTVPTTVRLPLSRRRMLEAIQSERGHEELADTLREALYEYIDRYLRGLDADPFAAREGAGVKEAA